MYHVKSSIEATLQPYSKMIFMSDSSDDLQEFCKLGKKISWRDLIRMAQDK